MHIQVRLTQIWSARPCYKFAAIIGKYKIHQSSFHTLKGCNYLNDEVCKYLYISYYLTEQLASYLS